MLLRPQHFQQAFLRSEMVAQEAWRLLTPYAWGVQHRDWELVKDRLIIRELDAVLPDGTRVQIAGSGPPFSVPLQATGERVYLGVPRHWAGKYRRFSADQVETVADLNVADNPAEVERLSLQVSAVHGTEAPPDQESLALCGVRMGPNGFEWTDYEPASFRVEPRSAIGRVCGELVQQIRGRLAGTARLTNVSAELRRQGALLAAALPSFELLVASGQAHPFSLYLALAQVAGLVAGLREAPVALDLPVYRHEDALPCFLAVIAQIQHSLKFYSPQTLRQFPFVLETNSYRLKAHPAWSGALNPDSGQRLVLGARAGRESSLDAIAAWVERAAIGLRSSIAGLQDRRELGAERKAGSPSERLQPEPGEVLFTLAPNERSPEALQPSEEDLFLVPSSSEGPRPQTLVLYVLEASS